LSTHNEQEEFFCSLLYLEHSGGIYGFGDGTRWCNGVRVL